MRKNKEVEKLKKEIEILAQQKVHVHSWEIVTAEGGVMAFFTGKLNIYQCCCKCGEVRVI